jgi:hypothetical protein
MSDLIDIDRRPTIPFTFEAHVALDENGRPSLVPINPARWLAGLRKMAGPVQGELRRPRKTRSSQANAYYWGVVLVDVMIAIREQYRDNPEACPFEDDEDLHRAMKWARYGDETIELPTGHTIKREKRTRTMDSKEHADFVNYVRRYWAERGVYTRDPGEEMRA